MASHAITRPSSGYYLPPRYSWEGGYGSPYYETDRRPSLGGGYDFPAYGYPSLAPHAPLRHPHDPFYPALDGPSYLAPSQWRSPRFYTPQSSDDPSMAPRGSAGWGSSHLTEDSLDLESHDLPGPGHFDLPSESSHEERPLAPSAPPGLPRFVTRDLDGACGGKGLESANQYRASSGAGSVESATGSSTHYAGQCRPCLYVHTKRGCHKGNACQFCHETHRNKAPRPSKATRDKCKALVAAAVEAVRNRPDKDSTTLHQLANQSAYMRSLLRAELEAH